MRFYPVITALWLLPCTVFSQTNISGVVNSYHKVIGINYAESGLKLDDVSGIVTNDRVMIVQMKGATVNTTVNSSSFGSVTSLNGAGNYELATVCDVRDDSVFLLQELLRTYSVADKVQLVKIPRYISATVTAPLEAAVWDSASGKGGVLAIMVSGTLTLNAPISASAKGFRGGVFYKDGGGCATNAFVNYAHNPTPGGFSFYSDVQRGAYKGESIADLVITLVGGKGACANGGGGGNNHNNGGGGGSNLASAGKGGDNLSTVGCGGQHAGVGGYALNSNSGERIFFGGGGGAGHANNTTSSSGGGYGGGIIFIQAQTLVTNGFSISANGSNGGDVYGDGASGGGGGGTIILSIANYNDNVSIEAVGGNGGNVDDEVITGRCYGEGGGGSGGVVYFSGAQPSGTVNIAGGSKGLKLNSTCASSTGVNGTAGNQVINYEFIESGTLSPCALLLDVEWIYFRTNITAGSVLLQWAVTGAADYYFFVERRKDGNWIALTKIPASEKPEYSFRDFYVIPGKYQYRVKLVSKEQIIYSSIQQLTVNGRDEVIRYDPLTQMVFVTSGICNSGVLQIFDVSGNCVYQNKWVSATGELALPVSFLKNGMFIAKTENTATKFIVAGQ
jgi:hypothetical protein